MEIPRYDRFMQAEENIDSLHPEARKIVWMRFAHQMPYPEVAQATGVDEAQAQEIAQAGLRLMVQGLGK